MHPHEVLQNEIVSRWAEEIALGVESGVILIIKYDPVIAAWEEQIGQLVREIQVLNACDKPTCAKACMACNRIRHTLEETQGKDLCINYMSAKYLFVKIKEIRYAAVKNFAINRSIADLFEEDESIHIVCANDTKVCLPTKIYNFFMQIDREYQNPVLLVQMVKYLEFEKTQRADAKESSDLVVRGLKVSFFYDPVYVESSRMNLYRKNNKA